MSILNFFGETISWHIFLQGVFCCFILYISGWLVYLTHFSQPENPNESINNSKPPEGGLSSWETILKSRGTTKASFNKISSLVNHMIQVKVIYVPLIIALLFVVGIIVHSVSDRWMDAKNYHHLGLKSLWLEDYQIIREQDESCTDSLNIKSQFLNNTDAVIKLKVFDQIFYNHSSICPHIKHQIFHNIKHELLLNKTWASYLGSTQTLINLSQGITFSIFILLLISLTNLILLLFKYEYWITILAFIILSTIFAFSFSSDKFSFIQGPFVFILILVSSANYLVKKAKDVSIGINKINEEHKIKEKNLIPERNIMLTVIFILLSTVTYYASACAWKINEEESCYKTLGVYKYEAKDLDYKENAFLQKD